MKSSRDRRKNSGGKNKITADQLEFGESKGKKSMREKSTLRRQSKPSCIRSKIRGCMNIRPEFADFRVSSGRKEQRYQNCANSSTVKFQGSRTRW
jgi:hypothetical protein